MFPFTKKQEKGCRKAEEWVAHIVSNEIQRPTLHVEEHQRPDGTFVPDLKRQVWSAITFKADLDPYDYADKVFHHVVISTGHNREAWRFFNAKIALMPGAEFGKGTFVMVFDSCCREVEEEHEPGDV